jgi:hypothetical protein
MSLFLKELEKDDLKDLKEMEKLFDKYLHYTT